MAIFHIKGLNDDGLDDLVRRHTARRPDEKKKIVADSSSHLALKEVLEKFCLLLKLDRNSFFYEDRFRELRDRTITELTEVLTPAEIEVALQLICYQIENEPKNETLAKLIPETVGAFITKFIQISYNAGNNNFYLNTKCYSQKIHDIGCHLNGTEERYVKVKIDGDVQGLCKRSSYCEFEINENIVRDLQGLGFKSRKCAITINGTFPVDEGILGINISESRLKTKNEETLRQLMSHTFGLNPKGCNYQILFIKPNEQEELVLKFEVCESDNCKAQIDINKEYYKFIEPSIQRKIDIGHYDLICNVNLF
ncbi:hypothetical protein J4434_08785 [Candidatus Woesearchaeota archaeon]|nr:hypothetical protein [Candidatus Woesearchaeota archaeon]